MRLSEAVGWEKRETKGVRGGNDPPCVWLVNKSRLANVNTFCAANLAFDQTELTDFIKQNYLSLRLIAILVSR